ncbi:zinc finger BED domain-containing protein RICESLEEPER 1 isoform X1 [Dendrobium catenatum]|uniref:zinc finger BED domain-containing protein RICESLEEPER 1 isoform X1 n=2 Tax=Dendrobium catenatum TaxID=906689 RepID=UPI0009F58833|nr:zinc finger BED domain-containing protein RICESLEEPER 1 isoform X1 [Dendrobium catenatum]
MNARKFDQLESHQKGKAKKMGDQTDLNSIEQDAFYVINDTAIEGNDVEIATEISVAPKKSSTKRNRRLTSAVWGYFELLPPGKDGRQRCKCRNCGTSYLYDSKFGTGNMKRHLKTCWKREARDVGQLLLRQYDTTPCSTPKFDHEKFKEILMEAIMLHDLPLQIVEWVGFRDLLLYLCPDLQLGTRNTMGDDCITMYRREKAKVRAILRATSNRISLTYDLWSSLNTDDYICLTAYFIDNNWNLQKKVLNFCLVPPHDETSLAQKLQDFLVDWGIDSKVSTITVTSALTNSFSVELLKSQLNSSKGSLWDSDYICLQCCAHTIDLIAQEGLKEIAVSLHKIRESIKYIKGSETIEQKFFECVTRSSLDDKIGLRQDVPTWWSSTFIMLDNALSYREAFMLLDISDINYKDCPSKSEWDNLEKIGKLLAVFYDIHCVFSNTKHPTANLYFPAIFSAYLTLKEEMGSEDECLRALAAYMLSLLEKYWSSFNMILAIAVILDPRYKFSFVEWCYKKLYGDGGALNSMNVKEKLYSLFSMYASPPKLHPGTKTGIVANNRSNKGSFSAPERPFSRATDDFFKEFDSLASEDIVLQKSQLELYLDDPRIDRKTGLDILSYWKSNQFKYPEVAAMARDILGIPFSTVTVESAFDESDRVLDRYQSALNSDILEAFICTRDWLCGDNDTTKQMLEELTKNIFQLNVNDKVKLPGCSMPGNHT